MPTPKKWYVVRFTCATLLVAVTLLGVSFGFAANRVHRQKRLLALFGDANWVLYDYQEEYSRHSGGPIEEPISPTTRWPNWLVSTVGEDWFVTVIGIELPYREGGYSDDFVEAMCDVHTLKYIRIGQNRLTQAQADRILAAHGRKAILDSSIQMDR
jgi:hypothetical protein